MTIKYDPTIHVSAGRPREILDRLTYRLAIVDTSSRDCHGYNYALVRLTLSAGYTDWRFADAETLLETVTAWDDDGKFHCVFPRAEYESLLNASLPAEKK